LPSENLHVIYNALDLRKIRPRPSEPHEKLILSVGRLVEKKGFPYLIEACHLLRSSDSAFECEIVGYGSMRKSLVELASSLQLNGQVRFVGPLPQEELIAHYHNASIFCLATLVASNDDRDVLPNVLKEAMAVGVPVVTTNVPGMEELVEHERTGLVVAPKDPVELARALERLMHDQELRKRLSAAARGIIEGRFERSKNTLQLLRLFEKHLLGIYPD
jgi:glycosyltransferase involved in cell wall biosynthesis